MPFAPAFLEKVTRVSPAGRALIQRFESCRLTSYRDGGGVWTIGWGTTRYPDGRRVGSSETCTQLEADEFFAHDLIRFELAIDALTTDAISQRQLDALTCCDYNIGDPAYRDSTLRRRVNANPDDPAIREAFMRFHFDNGKPIPGLWRRRHAEADHYFGVVTPLAPMPERKD